MLPTGSGSVAITKSSSSASSANVPKHHATMGRPASSINCFGAPKRSPRPPAATIAQNLTRRCFAKQGLPSVAGAPASRPRPLRWSVSDLARAFHLREDHSAGDGLQDARYLHVGVLADQTAPVFDYDHRPVVEIPDTLMRFFAVAHDGDVHLFAGQYDGLDGAGQFVDVEHRHAFDLRDPVEIVVVGNESAVAFARQPHQLRVDGSADVVVVALVDLERRRLLKFSEDVEPAAAARAFHRGGGVGGH